MATTISKLERDEASDRSIDSKNDTLPECITRDRLTSPYFPSTTRSTVAMVASLSLVFLLTSFNRLNHTDLWTHVNFGRWIVEHRALPAFDPITSQPSAIPVLQSAWLSQVLAYFTQVWVGNEGLILAHAVVVALTALVLTMAMQKRSGETTLLWMVPLAMFVLNLPIVGTIRPQLFGQLGVALTLLAVAQLLQGKWHPLVWLPMMVAVWSNLHGSMLMGVAMMGIVATGYSIENLAKSRGNIGLLLADRVVSRLWLAVVLMIVGGCVSPHGPAIWPRVILFGENIALQSITEWQRTSPTSLTGMLLIASSLATAYAFYASPRKWKLYEIMLLALFALATLVAIRMLAWWAIVWPFVMTPHLAAMWNQRFSREIGPTEASLERDPPLAMQTLFAMAIVFSTIVFAPPSHSLLMGKDRGETRTVVTATPVYLADEAVRMNLSGNLIAPMDWGDYLLMRTGGKLRPMVATHVHLVSPDVWSDYQKVFQGDPNWLTLARNRGMNYLAVSKRGYPKLAHGVFDADKAGRVRILYHDQKLLLVELPKKP